VWSKTHRHSAAADYWHCPAWPNRGANHLYQGLEELPCAQESYARHLGKKGAAENILYVLQQESTSKWQPDASVNYTSINFQALSMHASTVSTPQNEI